MQNLHLLSLFFFFLASTIAVDPITDPSDIVALIAFKSAISPRSINPWSCLATWDFTSDPCHSAAPTHFTCGLTCAAAYGGTSRVTDLTLDPAGYSGTLSPAISNLTFLTHLNIYDNSFYGSIPASISNLANLEIISISGNKFSGSVPESIYKIPNLNVLDLSRNQLTGHLPSFPPGLKSSLVDIDLSFNQLSGALPNSLPPNIVSLALRGNSISGFLRKTTFQSLKYLEVVELTANKLYGRIEGWFFLLPSLQQVNLSNNSINSINVWKPTNGLGERLVAVDLSFNKIEGELSQNFAEFPSLVSLSIKSNRLRGQIPLKYGKLKRLYLDGNFLNGELPDDLLKGELLAGSFGDNCLERCPEKLSICSPVQKPDWVCKQIYGVGGGQRRPHRLAPTSG